MTPSTALECQGLTLGHDRALPLISELDLLIKGAELTALIGPNGSGKSTLLRGLVGDLRPRSGQVLLNTKPLDSLSLIDRGRALAYLPQVRNSTYPMRVYDVVALGLYAYGGNVFGRLGTQERDLIEQVLVRFDLTPLRDRPLNQLSGGEQGRVHLARALVSGAKILVVDEPTHALDLKHQFDLLTHLKDLVHEGHLVLVVLHDLAQAAQVADRLVVMRQGRVVADGPPTKILTPKLGQEVFGIDLMPLRDEDGRFSIKAGPLA